MRSTVRTAGTGTRSIDESFRIEFEQTSDASGEAECGNGGVSGAGGIDEDGALAVEDVVLDSLGELWDEGGLGSGSYDPKALGRFGEEVAVRYLRSNGWKIIDRNYRCRYGEADIVGYDHGGVVLIEVKTRRGAEVFPEEMVDESKMMRYRNICLQYLITHHNLSRIRFDVIAVTVPFPGRACIRHIPDLSEWEG